MCDLEWKHGDVDRRTRAAIEIMQGNLSHEMLALLKAAKNHSTRDWAMILLAYRHGLRASEVCGVKLQGAAYAVLAGRPSKQAVIAVFGKSGYALSWFARADRLGITPEEMCERFKADSNRVKKLWAELEAENEKSDAK